MTDKIDVLYKKYDILTDAKDNIAKHSDVYLECIEGTKGTEKEKKLAAQIISQFFKHFPDHQKQAVEAVLDLCEDSDLSIRINAIKVLPIFCKDVKEHVSRVADILCQLITLLDDQDLNIACNSLIQVYKESPMKTVKAIFNYIFTSVENSREKCVHFLYKKLVKVDDKMAPEINDLLVEEGKKILQDSTASEFLTIMSFLSQSKLTKTTAGQQELVNAIADRAEIHKDFDLNDTENLHCERIIMCTQYALPLFNANVESTNFVKFYCEQILEKWDNIGTLKDGECLQYQILKQLAELSAHCGKLETPSTCIVQIFDKLKRYMPLPPEDGDIDKIPNLDFTSVECLLYAFHRLARQSPDFLTADPAVLKDFRSRLNYFSRGVGGCKRSLEKVQNKDDEKIKIAPTVLDNINALIKDLFYTTPIYKCNVQLSFKLLVKVKTTEILEENVNEHKNKLSYEGTKLLTKCYSNWNLNSSCTGLQDLSYFIKAESFSAQVEMASEKSQAPQKRHVPIHFDSSNGSTTKQVRSNKGSDNMKLYTPPSGKFSNNFQSYDRPGGRGRGRGGRGMRGMRGSPRGWRN